MSLTDGFGRVHDDLRVSVTDRCNLRCAYCMPVDPEWFPRAEILSYEETARLVRIAVGMGVRTVRVTGGEPLVRRDVDRLVRLISTMDGVDDLSLTTNGVLLEERAPALRAAGLRRVNVSLDTLDPDRFASLTGRRELPRVLRGLEAAARAGLAPVKVNTVLLRGTNDDEAEALVALARERGWEIRFIEFMPLENGGTWDISRVVSGPELRRRIGARWPLEPVAPEDPHAPATRWRFEDGRGHVGFIDSITAPFCGDCSRLRLTADGKFRVCLYDPAETDLKGPLRAGESDEELAGRMAAAVAAKGRGGALEILERRGAPRLVRTMHQIGG
jgi:cyclic pyranopterin phosphate synthase